MGNDSFLFALWCNMVYSYQTEFDPKSPHFHRADTQTSNRVEYGGSDGLCLVNLLCSISLCELATKLWKGVCQLPASLVDRALDSHAEVQGSTPG